MTDLEQFLDHYGNEAKPSNLDVGQQLVIGRVSQGYLSHAVTKIQKPSQSKVGCIKNLYLVTISTEISG